MKIRVDDGARTRRTSPIRIPAVAGAALVASLLFTAPRVHAQMTAPPPMTSGTPSTVIVSDDFERGQIAAPDTLMPNQIPTAIVTEPSGNHFVRMTATPEDCGPKFFTACPRTRAELWVGSAAATVNETVAYSFSLRIPSVNNRTGQNNLLWQLFQGYRIDPSGGRTIWLGVRNERLYVANQTGGVLQTIDVGPIEYDRWVHYSIVVHLADDASGRVDVYTNSTFVGSIIGQATILFRGYLTDMFLNVVSFNGVLGSADFDNVQITQAGDPLDRTMRAAPGADD